jgi:hypothetical protein
LVEAESLIAMANLLNFIIRNSQPTYKQKKAEYCNRVFTEIKERSKLSDEKIKALLFDNAVILLFFFRMSAHPRDPAGTILSEKHRLELIAKCAKLGIVVNKEN